MKSEGALRRAVKRERSLSDEAQDCKRARQSSPPAEPVFGRLQVTADADGISQVTKKRPDQVVVDSIADDAFASYGSREQAYKMLDKMMEHGNGEVFTCVVRFVPGPPSSQLRGPEIPAISAIPSSDVPPAPSGMPPPLPLEPSLLPPLEPPPPTSLASVPPLPPSPKQGATESAARSSRALSIQIKSEVSPGVETGRQVTDKLKGSNRQVARPASPKTVRQAPAQDNDRQVVQRFGMDDPVPSRESPEDMAIVPASKSHPQQSRRQKNKRSRNNNRGKTNNNNRHVYKSRPDPHTHIMFRRMGSREPYDFQQRNEQCANIICGSCSARGHHLLDCV
ncbi:hypothetical protein CABS01_08244 [Colletotrichum abscissum]|uniref:Uncharacterized protein n=1 Tax=Colletotrichum abscissum TaxID=1671311 RepID=A0A9P9XJ11_9PEZI|nr:uncharacterized protein CABS01_08244 [Colletotrichum abscissum]KAI3555142.1 hypothetical protein CABS02_04590 [Colletotrichum abscissum]KAK1509014.1 hypothetical protein CABS01_08244 [Colletotrichum abscissum]